MYTIATQTDGDFEETLEKVTEELEKEGFGILTEIDVQKTLKKKLDEDFRKYRILGACNPELAHKAFEKEISIGALLPCNVIVYEDSGKVFVEAADPEELLSVAENSELEDIASEVKGRLEKVIEAI
ncbi:MAG: DUF302 domain-containing protein [Candidatus Nanohalobium sp.]